MRWIGARRGAGWALAAGVALTSLSGCGGGGGTGDEQRNTLSPLVGRWRITRITATASGVPIGLNLPCPGSTSIPTVGSAACTDHERIEFRADHTFTASGGFTVDLTAPGAPTIPTLPTNATGVWALDGATLTVTADPASGTTTPVPAVAATASFTADTPASGLTLTITQNGATGVATLVRE